MIDNFAWASDTLALAAIAATGGAVILVVACVSCWACKSKHRWEERRVGGWDGVELPFELSFYP